MLDAFARTLIESAERPSQLNAAETRDLISRAYIQWLANHVFESEAPSDAGVQTLLNRLSLASSLLRESNGASNDPTAFLVAEASEIARLRLQNRADGLSTDAAIQRAVHYLDLASFFHFADYDANAGVVARDAVELLRSGNGDAKSSYSTAKRSYYRCLGYFLSGEFGNCRAEAATDAEGQITEDRAFLFLRAFLARLTRTYVGEELDGQQMAGRFEALQRALSDSDNPYATLLSEVTRLSEFEAAASRKSLYRLLAPIFSDELTYLRERVSGDDSQDYPFAWPPTREFVARYFEEGLRHAAITVPTGGGKSFLAEIAAAQALKNGWVLYMAPTNALCAQIRADLQSSIGTISDIGVEAFFGSFEYTADLPQFEAPRIVLAITPEKALLLLKREPERFRQCSLVVLDECHLLGSKNRGDIAEIVLAFALQQNPEIRTILMSALVQDSKKLSLWLEQVTGAEVAQVTLPWRPTRTARLTVLPDWDTREQSETPQGATRETVKVRAFADTVTPWEEATPLENWITPVEIERTGNRDFRWVNHVSRRLAEILTSRNLPTLVFVLHNRHHAFSIANDYSVELDERPALSQSEEDRLVLAEYELGASSMIRELITTKHSTVHTATMLNCEREASESAFRRGSAVLMTATGTLSQGLNLPAKAVVICGTKLSEFSDEDEQDPTELRRRSLNQVLNAAGRAARAGVTCRGLSIIVPDDLNMIDDIDKDSPKQAFFGSIEALALKDASLSVDSQLFELLNSVQLAIDDSEATSQERVLLSKFPVDSEGLNQTVQSTLGLYELGDDNAGDRIINRLEKVKSNAIASGIDDWILRAASLAAIDFSLAGNLRDYINNQSQRHDSVMPDDTYVGWAVFLVNWLQTLPAPDIWELLRFHIKSWRYYWGKRSDPDLLDLLATEGYPLYVTENARTALEPIWKNALDTVRAWLDDQTYLALGETLTRRSCPPKRRSSRTSPGHHLVRALTWNQRFIERLSRYAGLLLAIQNQWLEHDPETIPTWLAETETLHTFPLGLRHGVANPSALAWHRYAIQERRAANLLDSLVPIPGRQLTSIQDAWPLVREARTVILESDLEDRETDTLQVIRRLISESE